MPSWAEDTACLERGRCVTVAALSMPVRVTVPVVAISRRTPTDNEAIIDIMKVWVTLLTLSGRVSHHIAPALPHSVLAHYWRSHKGPLVEVVVPNAEALQQCGTDHMRVPLGILSFIRFLELIQYQWKFICVIEPNVQDESCVYLRNESFMLDT